MLYAHQCTTGLYAEEYLNSFGERRVHFLRSHRESKRTRISYTTIASIIVSNIIIIILSLVSLQADRLGIHRCYSPLTAFLDSSLSISAASSLKYTLRPCYTAATHIYGNYYYYYVVIILSEIRMYRYIQPAYAVYVLARRFTVAHVYNIILINFTGTINPRTIYFINYMRVSILHTHILYLQRAYCASRRVDVIRI